MSGKPLPPRPYLPPATAGAAGCVAAGATVMELGWRRFSEGSAGAVAPLTGVAAIAGAALVAVLVRYALRALADHAPKARGLAAWWSWFSVCAVATTVASMAGVAARHAAWQHIDGTTASAYTFKLTGDPRQSGFGTTQTADMFDRDGSRVATVKLELDEGCPSGTAIQVVGRIQPLEGDEWGRSDYMAGSVATVDVALVTSRRASSVNPVERLRNRALGLIDPAASPERALVAGIVCGRTTELNAEGADEPFATTGTSHLVAVSGGHLVLVSAMVSAVLRIVGCRPRTRSAVLLFTMAVYVVFAGAASSAVRSLVMVASTLAAQLLGRRAHGPSALMLTVIALVLLDPGVVYDLGFQLSAASVLFIQLFGGYLTALFETLHLPRPLAEALALTCSSQWATLPITLPVFGELSLVAPLANVVLGPLMSGLLVCGLVASALGLVAAPLAVLMVVPEAVARISIFVADVCSSIPFASVPLDAPAAPLGALHLLAVAVYLLWRLPDARLVGAATLAGVLALGGHVVRWTWFAPLEIVLLDVGQGDAILMRDGEHAVLVDAGVDDATARALMRVSCYQLDAVVVTHWDRDHWGGLERILPLMPVGRILVAEGATSALPDELRSRASDVAEISAGDELAVGRIRASMVLPADPVAGEENEESVVLDVTCTDGAASFSLLLTGDAEADVLCEVADEVGDIDVLKLGHHGSKVSVDEELLDTLRPELSIASAGEGNDYGHPDPHCVDLVLESGSRFMCTIDAGDIHLTPAPGGVRVAAAGAGG